MAKRKDATITKYEAGGYLMRLEDGTELEADTIAEAMRFAYNEGATRVYSAARPDGTFVTMGREDR